MYGAIIGDVAGSIYEVMEINALKKKTIRSKMERSIILNENFPLFTNMSSMTDDSILTCSIADSILNSIPYEENLKKYGIDEVCLGFDKYGRNKFGYGFIKWLNENVNGDSFGNGCAMRISPVGYLFDDLETIKKESRLATTPSHNHPESIKCSEAVSVSIYLLRNGISKEELKKYIEDNYFKLDFDLEDLRNNYRFTSRAIHSVPQAIFVFLESNSFEETIRNAISIGGDVDTISCIAGSIAESYYKIPDYLIKSVRKYIPNNYQKIVNEFYLRLEFNNFMKQNSMYNKDFIDCLSDKVRIIDTDDKSWFGCFPILDRKNRLVGIRLLIPKLNSIDNLLVWIHEYTHAYELYNKLGMEYIENIIQSEKIATDMEKRYILKNNIDIQTNV